MSHGGTGVNFFSAALQALSSAVQPRALWLAAHHYELAPSLDPGWAHLLQSLSTSLGVHDDGARTRRSAQPPGLVFAIFFYRAISQDSHDPGSLCSIPEEVKQCCSPAVHRQGLFNRRWPTVKEKVACCSDGFHVSCPSSEQACAIRQTPLHVQSGDCTAGSNRCGVQLLLVRCSLPLTKGRSADLLTEMMSLHKAVHFSNVASSTFKSCT